MDKTHLFLIIGSLILSLILFQLPRSVVENDQLQEVSETQNHSFQIPQEIENQIAELRKLLKEENSFDKKVSFARSLAEMYLDYSVLDSAVKYAEAIEKWVEEPSKEAADIYFIAFERSNAPDGGIGYARKAREILSRLMEKDSSNLFLKNRLAMTLVVSDNPMSGIEMLKGILAEDKINRQAILNLGLLAIQSGQFKRAKERFENLISLDIKDYEAKLYLAVSMMEINQKKESRLLLEEILTTQDSIPVIKMMANDYLQIL